MNDNTNLVFKLKIHQEEMEQFILRALELDNQIRPKEEMFFTQMTKVGKSLIRVDRSSYPYCGVCGAKLSENYSFWWYYEPHVDARNRLLGYGKYEFIKK